MTLLAVSGLHAGYGQIPVLDDVSFTIAPGEFVGILGQNGMGKTTLLNAVMGSIKARSGSIMFDGRDLTRLPLHRRARAGVGLVPQGREIFPALTVADNLRLGALRSGQPAPAMMASILADFPRLERLLGRQGATLSGGEQQLLALARTMCTGARLVLLDEPTEGIQPSILDEITAILKALRVARPDVSFLIVEQKLAFILGLCDRLLVLTKGRITREWTSGQQVDVDGISSAMGFSAAGQSR